MSMRPFSPFISRRFREVLVFGAGVAFGAAIFSAVMERSTPGLDEVSVRPSPYKTYLQAFDPRTGEKAYEIWAEYGRLHRVGGPAVVYANGESSWYVNGVLHRVGGPAIVRRDARTGEIVQMFWYRNGNRYTPTQNEVLSFLTREIQSESPPPPVSESP